MFYEAFPGKVFDTLLMKLIPPRKNGGKKWREKMAGTFGYLSKPKCS
jgi:hypothetical protein